MDDGRNKIQGKVEEEDPLKVVALLKACGKKKDIQKGIKLHAKIVKKGLLGKCPYVATTLISMYAKCGEFSKAQQVFEELPTRTTSSWNALLSLYAQQGQGHEALSCLELMEIEGLLADNITYLSILKSCGCTGSIDKGKHIHDDIVRKGLLKNNSMLGNALVDMYAKCNLFGEAWKLLEELPCQNIVAWNALISVYVEQGQGHEALKCYQKIEREGISPDIVMFTCLLKACGSTGAIDKGKEIHGEIVSRGFLEKDIVLGTTLVDMYAKCGMLEKAQEVLEDLSI